MTFLTMTDAVPLLHMLGVGKQQVQYCTAELVLLVAFLKTVCRCNTAHALDNTHGYPHY